MKYFPSIVLLLLLTGYVAKAQNESITITGPACVQPGDTLVYRVSKQLPGYVWHCPPGFRQLSGGDDAALICVVQNNLMAKATVMYKPLAKGNMPAYSLLVLNRVVQPNIFFTTADNGGNVIQQVPNSVTHVVLNILPSSVAVGNAYKYAVVSHNATWTFGEGRTTAAETAVSPAAQRIKVNVGNGKATIAITTTGGCDSRTDVIDVTP